MNTNDHHQSSDEDLLREIHERAALVKLSIEKTRDPFLEYLFGVFNLELSQRIIMAERGYETGFKK